MRESYSPADAPSSPALPELADPPPERFQFGIRTLLALMFVAAVISTGVYYAAHYFLRLNERVPAFQQYIFLPEAILLSVLLIVWSYFVFRTVFLARHVIRIGRRWRAAQRRRREMESWLAARRQALTRQDGGGSSSPLG